MVSRGSGRAKNQGLPYELGCSARIPRRNVSQEIQFHDVHSSDALVAYVMVVRSQLVISEIEAGFKNDRWLGPARIMSRRFPENRYVADPGPWREQPSNLGQCLIKMSAIHRMRVLA
jgi:hypothetical protein